MLKPPHPVAWAAYATTMLLNPNNHALDGGPATRGDGAARPSPRSPRCSACEPRSATSPPPARSPTSRRCGSRASCAPTRRSSSARTPTTPTSACARSCARRSRSCRRTSAGASTSTRSSGGCAPAASAPSSRRSARPASARSTRSHEIADLCERHGARLHVDAAYGGFHTLLADGVRARRRAAPFAALRRADSIVVDPHKHGLQPYGCGCVLFADPGVGRLYAHDSPYTYFTSKDTAPRRDQPRVQPCRRCGRGALGDARGAAARRARASARARRRPRRGAALARRLERSGAGRGRRRPDLDIVCPFPRRRPRLADQRRLRARLRRPRRATAGMPPSCASQTAGSRAPTADRGRRRPRSRRCAWS